MEKFNQRREIINDLKSRQSAVCSRYEIADQLLQVFPVYQSNGNIHPQDWDIPKKYDWNTWIKE